MGLSQQNLSEENSMLQENKTKQIFDDLSVGDPVILTESKQVGVVTGYNNGMWEVTLDGDSITLLKERGEIEPRSKLFG